ncbi:ABC transporter permease [Amycolatopsis pithecellobii]|uniref:ABC transporter permease subunit n=1 Tax=Amycolatopsis pithecellobii TaxID=664692 RepID=A0A6N7Z804_9PSEU|nr:ABC transporter permease [Amycolatopsis pithecellobii]MTD57594.1 ABC transporter permease subunit [Amycolatopsis pithecellobii]
MLRLTAWRVARMVPLLFLVSIGAFGLVYLIPGDPASAIAGQDADPAQVAAIRSQLGLDKPVWEQYWHWISGLAQGRFGTSLYDQTSVVSSIQERFPVTLSLTVAALVVALAIGIPVGILAATHRGTVLDRAITALSTVGIAMPAFWLGLLLIIGFSLKLNVLPAVGYVPWTTDPGGWLEHITLPAVTLGLAAAAELARHTRSALSETLQQDYIRTARMIGIRSHKVNLKHALKNAGAPILTIFSFQVSFLLGGSLVVEQIFNLPGLGSFAISAVGQKDLPVIQAVVMVTALIVMGVNLLTDIAYGYLNPRVRAT